MTTKVSMAQRCLEDAHQQHQHKYVNGRVKQKVFERRKEKKSFFSLNFSRKVYFEKVFFQHLLLLYGNLEISKINF
jgi:hypothetical protein